MSVTEQPVPVSAGPEGSEPATTHAYVRRLEAQRNLLVREVHHRIKNSLQGVAGMLRQHALDHPEAAAALEAAIAQVRTLAVIHGLEGESLYNEVVLCEIAPSVARMVEELVVPRRPIHVTVAVPQRIRVSEQERVPVALVLNELILNAAKHACPEAAGVAVQVSVAWQAQADQAVITITNPGVLPAGLVYAQGRGLGTGLDLVQSMLPPEGAQLCLRQAGPVVMAQLLLSAPVIYRLDRPVGPT